MQKKATKQSALTEQQELKFPQMLSAFLLIPLDNQTSQQNLQLLIGKLDDATKKNVYQMVKEDLTARGNRQVAAIRMELQTM